LIRIASTSDAWMIAVSISEGKYYHFVLYLLEMTKIFLDDHFLLIDISKQNYELWLE
jgi:hypothetical protein